MNILPTAYAPRQGESLGKHSLQKIDAIPEEVRSAIDDGLNDIRFNGYRWECNAKTGWARVSPISSPANAEPESPEQSQANARADFMALQGEYLSVKPEGKSEKKSAVDIVNELRSKAAAKTSQTAPQQEAPEEPEQAEATQDDQPQGDKADSSSDNLDKVRSYRKFETERYVNDRLFRDGFLEVLSPAAVKLLLFIGSKCNDDGVCFHAHETMMQLTGLSRNTIKRAITELIENKLIETKAVAGKSNHYRLL